MPRVTRTASSRTKQAPDPAAALASNTDTGIEAIGALAPLDPLEARIPESLAGDRIDKVLARLFPDYSRSRLQAWLEAGLVHVDGRRAKPRESALAFAKVVVTPQHTPETLAFSPEAVPLEVVYEDAHMLVINKPAGLVVHPGAGNWQGTVLNGLLHRYGAQAAALPRAGIVHRLDKETSGLMVVARTLVAQTDLIRQLQARTVKRRYVCLVWGVPKEGGTIDAPIGRDPRDRLRMAVVHGNAGKAARTHYRVVGEGELDGRRVAALWCDLETGRTHQIRVHCKHIGHPLVGDTLYGKVPRVAVRAQSTGRTGVSAASDSSDVSTVAAAMRPGRQALHAWSLGLRHPDSGETLRWEALPPEDMAGLAAHAEIDLLPEEARLDHDADDTWGDAEWEADDLDDDPEWDADDEGDGPVPPVGKRR
ncbi:23S rRNA pseudouridine1911/1915/1917 synthase [Robbsia andropogonis]|uniref:RluA family pseudouridine synthase n=1 Tax=Robbsia andropogonis TaxID=28092 RepID=UPI003D208BD8